MPAVAADGKRVICTPIVDIFDDRSTALRPVRSNRVHLSNRVQVTYLQPCTAPTPRHPARRTHSSSTASPATGTSRPHPSCAGNAARWPNASCAPCTGARLPAWWCRPARSRHGSCISCLRRMAPCIRRTASRWPACAKKACRFSSSAVARTRAACRPTCRTCAMRCCGKRWKATIFRRTRWRCAISAATRLAPTSSS